jgi:endonuclease YncB( thermonuclease family)
MRRCAVAAGFLFVLTGPLGAQPSTPNDFEGKVLEVTDGDTFRMKIANDGPVVKIRVYGMDAPETDQAFGETARNRLKELIDGKTVKIKRKAVSYGRVVGDVHLDGERVGLRMIGEGLARWYKDFAENEFDLKLAEQEAKEEDRGIWKGSQDPVPPWEWRQIMRIVKQEKKLKQIDP